MSHASPLGHVRGADAVGRAHGVDGVDVDTDTGDGIALSVVLGTVGLAGGVLPLFVVLPHDQLAGAFMLPLLVWPLLCLGGAVALDRAPRSRTARAAVAVGAVVPSGVVVTALLRPSQPGAGLAAGVAETVATISPGLLVALLVPALLAESAQHDPPARRWRAWLGVVGLTTVVAGSLASRLASDTAYAVIGCVGIAGTAWLVAASATSRPPPPMVETALDVLLAVGVVGVASGVGTLVGRFAVAEQIRAATALGWVAGLAAVALALPSAAWVRREHLRHRYGPGVLDPKDLAAVSAGLATDAGPRELLGRTAAMVVRGSGLAEVRVVLEDVAPPPGWHSRTLRVGGAVVGTMLLRAPRDGTVERRHEDVVDRLAPTVALVVRAVTLAVDADHARADTERERERERTRILRDLHDDLGPVLSGLAMRVAAERGAHPDLDVLHDVADALAGCQAELRRIVARLTPSVLDDATLEQALRGLVDAFGGSRGIVVALADGVPDGLADDVAGVAYRAVAEGVTNAVRHGSPSRVEVSVRRTSSGSGSSVEVVVRDDGRGGPVVPGTGLSSIRARSEEIGGRLEVVSGAAGTTLGVVLPEAR